MGYQAPEPQEVIMAEPDKQQIGEGSDSYGSAARNAGKAIRQAGQNAAKESAQKGAEAAANAAALVLL